MDTETKNNIDIACDNYKQINGKGKFLKLDEWLLKESETFKDENNNISQIYLKYKRGQVIKVNFGVNIGTELSHTHFAIVLNSDDTRLTDNITVVPLTSKNGYKRINLGNLVSNKFASSKYDNTTYAYITQIKTIRHR